MTLLATVGDVLRSPIWVVLAPLVALAAIIITVRYNRQQQERRALGCAVNITPLVTVHSAAKERVKIFYDEDRIQQAHLVEARIKNTGNVPIRKEDFEDPITFDPGKGAMPLTTTVTRPFPSGLRAEVKPEGRRVVLEPLLLNPGDGLTVQFLVRNLQGNVSCYHRIVGISQLDDLEGPPSGEEAATGSGRPLTRRESREAMWQGARNVLVLMGAGVLIGGSILSLALDRKTHSVVRLTSGDELCGKVLQANDRNVVVRLADGGKIQSLPLQRVESIEDDSC